MNFKEYIENDIEEKKVLLNLLPRNTEVRLKKYKDTISQIITKYENSINSTKAFIDYKYNKLLPKEVDKDAKMLELNKRIDACKKVLKEINSKTSYFEKLGFDDCLYKLMHYYDNSILDNNTVLVEFVSIFERAGIKLTSNDFKINIYAYIYMDYFFKVYKDRAALNNEKFEKIFWNSPKVFENIIVIFRMLIKKNEFKLKMFVKRSETQLLKEYGVSNKNELVKEVMSLNYEVDKLNDSNEYEIINDFMSETLDLSLYMNDDSLKEDLDFFLINPIDINNSFELSKTINSIFNFEDNLFEYKKYYECIVLFDEIKKKYEKNLLNVTLKDLGQKIKVQEKAISKLAGTLKKYQIIKKNYDIDKLEILLEGREKEMVLEQQKVFNTLYSEYSKYNELYFDNVLKTLITSNSLANDFVEIVISYPFFGRKMVKKVFELENEDEIDEKMFLLFNMFYNIKKRILNMKSVFSKENFERELMNGYRFENLNVHEDSFEEENYELILFNCSKLHIRLKMKSFTHSVDEIKFLLDIKKLKDSGKI